MTHSNTTLSKNPHYDAGDIALSVLSSVLLWIIVPGCAFVYSGGSRAKNALTTLMQSFWTVAVVSIQWWAVGYSLTFSSTGGLFIGNFDKVFLRGVYDNPAPVPAQDLPELAFCLYQAVTAILGPCFILGITAERGRLLPSLVFTLIWSTFVYDFVGYWSLNQNGWATRLGFLDFGGGAPVHLPVGGACLAYTMILGPTKPSSRKAKPHNMANVFLGTILLWIGSFGYNAGSAFRSNLTAIMACMATNLSGSAGAIVWSLLDYFRIGNFSAFGFCLGAMCGLVTIVPASGYVGLSSSVAIGCIGSACCYFVSLFKDRFFFDDVMDVFIVNGVGGILGNVLAGVFTQKFYGGEEVGSGGWLDGNWMQVPLQLADSAATFTLSFVVSFISLYGMNKTKWLRLRVTEAEENAGIDDTEVGVKCYEFVDGILPELIQEKPSKLIISNKIGQIEVGNEGFDGNGRLQRDKPLRSNWMFN